MGKQAEEALKEKRPRLRSTPPFSLVFLLSFTALSDTIGG
jgi:hypothetical protein